MLIVLLASNAISIVNLYEYLYMCLNHVNKLQADNIATYFVKVTFSFKIGKEIIPGISLYIGKQVLVRFYLLVFC